MKDWKECPWCQGSGEYDLSSDFHRSAEMVPCANNPEERLAAAAWAATQEIAGSSAHRARLDEAVAVMAPAETWNELKQAWRGRDMASTVAPWGASADRRAAEAVVLTGAKFQGPDLPVAAALASHRRAVMAAEADPFFGCTAGAPDRGVEGLSGERYPFRDKWASVAGAIMAEQDAVRERPLAEQCAILPERQAQQSDAFFNRQIDEHGETRRLREENARLRAELRTMRAVINAALGE